MFQTALSYKTGEYIVFCTLSSWGNDNANLVYYSLRVVRKVMINLVYCGSRNYNKFDWKCMYDSL